MSRSSTPQRRHRAVQSSAKRIASVGVAYVDSNQSKADGVMGRTKTIRAASLATRRAPSVLRHDGHHLGKLIEQHDIQLAIAVKLTEANGPSVGGKRCAVLEATVARSGTQPSPCLLCQFIPTRSPVRDCRNVATSMGSADRRPGDLTVRLWVAAVCCAMRAGTANIPAGMRITGRVGVASDGFSGPEAWVRTRAGAYQKS